MPLLVVRDRPNAHRSRAAMDVISAHAQDHVVAYASELSPEKQCNAFVNRAMANALPGSVADLQRRPEMITSFFRHAGLSIASLR